MYRSLRDLPILLAATAVANLVPAQGGGFTPGTLFFNSSNLPHPGGVGGIALIDPLTGNATLSVNLYAAHYGVGAAAFDPYRQRLVFTGRQTSLSGMELLFSDGLGNVTPSGHGSFYWDGFAPTGDGRVYFHEGAGIRWLDAANQLHVLCDTDGVTPIANAGFATFADGMIWHAGTNALFVAVTHPSVACTGGPSNQIYVRKLPLTPDGTHLASPVQCASFDVDPAQAEAARGWSRLPDGSLLLLGYPNPNATPLPRLLRVDPATLTASTWASFVALHTPGGTYSTALGSAVVYDNSAGSLQVIAPGTTSGNGAALPVNIALGGADAAMGEIPIDACHGAWVAYGAGLAGTGGIVPRLYGAGCPQVGPAFAVQLDQAVGGALGILVLGSAPASFPLFGGTLLVAPIDATLAFACGGSVGAAGTGTFQLPLLLTQPALIGVSFCLQAGLLDPASIQGFAISNGLQLVIG